MSDVFSPPPPPAALPLRPAALKVFGILNLVFGVIGVVSVAATWHYYYTPLEGKTDVMAELMRHDPFYARCMRVLMVPGTLVALAQVVSGIGLLQSRDGARRLALFTGIYVLLAAIFLAYLTIYHVLPFTVEETLKQMSAATKTPMDPAMVSMMRLMTRAGGIMGAISGLVYPTLLLIFLSRPKVREYCLSRAQG